MYDLYSAQLNDRFQRMLEMGLKVGGFQGPTIKPSSTQAWLDSKSTEVQGGPFGASDMGPFQGLQKARPKTPPQVKE